MKCEACGKNQAAYFVDSWSKGSPKHKLCRVCVDEMITNIPNVKQVLNICEITMDKFTFSGIARLVGRQISDHEIIMECGVWNNGIGIFSDNEGLCDFRFQPGQRYEITVEGIK